MTETAQTIKDSLEVITPYLQSLADKLDTTASYLWKIQINQAYIQGITALAIPIILAMVAFIAYKIGLSVSNKILEDEIKKTENYNKENTSSWSFKKEIPTISDYYFAIVFTTMIPLILSLIILLSGLKNIITCLFNPEYYALQQLINMFK